MPWPLFPVLVVVDVETRSLEMNSAGTGVVGHKTITLRTRNLVRIFNVTEQFGLPVVALGTVADIIPERH